MCDRLKSEYPSITAEIMSAPNRYRRLDRGAALALQMSEFPDRASRARGLDMCFMCWDEILVWDRAA